MASADLRGVGGPLALLDLASTHTHAQKRTLISKRNKITTLIVFTRGTELIHAANIVVILREMLHRH